MAIINRIDNSASITYGGNSINSNTVSTLLLLAPTITKTVDKATANIGDILTYTITITNLSLAALPTLPFTDTIARVSLNRKAQLFTVTAEMYMVLWICREALPIPVIHLFPILV